MFRLLFVFLFALNFLAGATSRQEGQPPLDSDQIGLFFSGTIADMAPDKITVTRAVLGKPAEKKVFLIDPTTKVEGKMRAKVRVTVRYKTTEDGDVAKSILVRNPQAKKP